MEVLPSEYQQLDLQRFEKMFVRYAESCGKYGYVFLNTNAAMIQGEKQHMVITEDGVTLLKFFDSFENPDMFSTIMSVYYTGIYLSTLSSILKKLIANKALVDKHGKSMVRLAYACVFPNLSRNDIPNDIVGVPESFILNGCIFKEEFAELKKDFISVISKINEKTGCIYSESLMTIDEKNINSILQRLAPEYTIIRVCGVENTETLRGVDDELLVVTNDDKAVRAYRLEKDQINIVNSISKGNQLILACAGSGKSVILIAKCFKAARMNPDKRFLITCKSKQLMSLYTWYIDRAGLKERNVECVTFHGLCKKLATNNHFILGGDINTWADTVTYKLNHNQIKDRYYGIFIDEVQLFDQEWYKICFNLLENRDSDEHLFVICGDKTQEIKNKQKHGRAPWNAGDGYPNYRGGHKSIRIEKNYRNCSEINSYINRYAAYAKNILGLVSEKDYNDPDLFLRGKAIRDGVGAYIKCLNKYTAKSEADRVLEAVKEAHNVHKIPYDEIAIVTYYKTYGRHMKSWGERTYNVARHILINLIDANIPYCEMYSDSNSCVRYGNNDGVAMISFDSVLGLDFRAVIVCGLKPLGDYDGTKFLTTDVLKNEILDDEQKDNIRKNISYLYVACTRARDVLYIIQPEKKAEDSLYMELIQEAMEDDE